MLNRNLFSISRPFLSFSEKSSSLFSRNLASTAHARDALSSDSIVHLLRDVEKHGGSYGFHTEHFSSLGREKILLEYSSPNIAKLFHVGHYRSTVVGNAIGNILNASGHEVTTINYLGDWGFQFALLAFAYRKYGDEQKLKEQPLKHLFDLYVKISSEVDSRIYDDAQAMFVEMEKGTEKEALEFWNTCRTLSIDEYKKQYGEIGITFDVYEGESDYVKSANEQLDVLKEKSLLFSEENALKIDLTNSMWLSDVEDSLKRPVLARANGTTLYLTRDVAAAIRRFEKYEFDRLIYVTDQSQALHFKQLFGVLEQLGFAWARKDAGRLVHVPFGRVQKMQTRKGSAVFLSDILKEAYDKAHFDRHECANRKASIDDHCVTKTIALSGLIYHDLRTKLSKGYKFNWDTALASKGNSGLYLQYTYSRLCSVERYAGARLTTDIDPQRVLSEPSLVDLLCHVSAYTDVTVSLHQTLEPSDLVKYLYQLCRLSARAFEHCIVKNQPANEAEARLACFHAARTVLGNGLRILGITPLEQH